MLKILNEKNCSLVNVITPELFKIGQFVSLRDGKAGDYYVSGENPIAFVYKIDFNGTVTFACPHAILKIVTPVYDRNVVYKKDETLYVNGSGILTNEKPSLNHVVIGKVVTPGISYMFGATSMEAEIFALPVGSVVKSSGLTCKNCRDFFPYAEESNQEDGSFKCWGCRNA